MMMTAHNAKISKTPQKRIYDALVKRGYVVKAVRRSGSAYWSVDFYHIEDAETTHDTLELRTIENLLRGIRRLPRKG